MLPRFRVLFPIALSFQEHRQARVSRTFGGLFAESLANAASRCVFMIFTEAVNYSDYVLAIDR